MTINLAPKVGQKLHQAEEHLLYIMSQRRGGQKWNCPENGTETFSPASQIHPDPCILRPVAQLQCPELSWTSRRVSICCC